MKKIICILAAGICFSGAGAQEKQTLSHKQNDRPILFFGPGIGITYGGLVGVKAELVPVKTLGISAAAGYYLIGPGFNVGVNFKVFPDARFCPLIYGTYGSNSVIKVEGARSRDKIYKGFGTGIGADLRVGKNSNKIFLGLQYSFWDPQFETDFQDLKSSYTTTPSRVGFNFGFNFALHKPE